MKLCKLAAHLIAVCFVCSLWAANPKAGLEPTPQWTTSEQLKSKWGKVPLEELRAQAEKGDPEAQHYLAWRYTIGDGLPKDPAAAASWYRKAADQGFALAQNNLGASYADGAGVAKDLAEAKRWFRLAAEQGLPVGLAALGRLNYRLLPSSTETNESLYLVERAAESGDYRAAVTLGYWLCFAPPVGAIEPERGVYWLLYAAKNGEVSACGHLGWLYIEGMALPKNLDEARRWFEKGAVQDDPYCQYSLAQHELIAHPAAPDLAFARRWLLKAAAKNSPQALFVLGRISELDGIAHEPSLRPNYAEAAQWYERAADVGNEKAAARLAQLTILGKTGKAENIIPRLQRAADLDDQQSQLELAFRYLRGEGKPRHAQDTPVELLKKLGGYSPEGLLLLAEFYRTGKHVPKDPLQAIYYLCRAASFGDPGRARFVNLRDTASSQRPPMAANQGLEAHASLFMEAVFSSKNEAAVRVASNYLNGTYAANPAMAYAWLSLAAKRQDDIAAAERDRLRSRLDSAALKEGEDFGIRLFFLSRDGPPK